MNKIIIAVILIIGTLAIAGTYIQRHKIDVTSGLQGSRSSGVDIVSDTSAGPAPSGTADMVAVISQISLSVTSPSSGTTVASPTVAVIGRTLPKAEIFANEAEGVADTAGNFSLTVKLDDGENSIIITAVDGDGNVAEKEIIVTYNAGE